MLKRKVSLRDSYVRRKREEGKVLVWNRNGKIKRKRPLKKVSRSQRTKLKGYFAIRNEFLSRPENVFCAICVARFNAGEEFFVQRAVEVHHKRGRNGPLLCDDRFFVPSCYDCSRNWVHHHSRLARTLGVLAEAKDWGVPGKLRQDQ